MSYGWATLFTLAAWFVGGLIDGAADLGFRTVLPVIVMYHAVHQGQQPVKVIG